MIIGLLITTIVAAIVAMREKKKQADQRGIIVTASILGLIATIVTIVAGLLTIGYTIWKIMDDHMMFWW